MVFASARAYRFFRYWSPIMVIIIIAVGKEGISISFFAGFPGLPWVMAFFIRSSALWSMGAYSGFVSSLMSKFRFWM